MLEKEAVMMKSWKEHLGLMSRWINPSDNVLRICVRVYCICIRQYFKLSAKLFKWSLSRSVLANAKKKLLVIVLKCGERGIPEISSLKVHEQGNNVESSIFKISYRGQVDLGGRTALLN